MQISKNLMIIAAGLAGGAFLLMLQHRLIIKNKKRITAFLERNPRLGSIVQGVAFAFVFLIQGTIIYLDRHPQQTERIRNWIVEEWKHPGVVAVCLTIIVILSGKIASVWKRNAQRSYGICEVLFGALLSFNTLFINPRLDLSRLVALGGAIYVISRGFNNIAESSELVTTVTAMKNV